jgi:hypothetical protein
MAIIPYFCLALAAAAFDDFSGPQKGEPLPECSIKVIIGPDKGKTVKYKEPLGDKAAVLIFVHEITRPSVGMSRSVINYAVKRKKDGLESTVVFLTADPTETQDWMKRARRALPTGINVGISTDGIEGPGAFGLNRKMQVTALLIKQKYVVANFALAQPSPNSDVKKIGNAIAKMLGDEKMPTERELGLGGNRMAMNKSQISDGDFRALLGPVIRKTSTPEEVETAAVKVEEEVKKNPALRKRLFEVTNRIIDAGKLENYGSEKAQEYLTKWSKELAPKKDDKKKTAKEENDRKK